MTKEELQKEIDELEELIAECDFGSVSYDFLTAEVEYLYLKMDRISKKEVDISLS